MAEETKIAMKLEEESKPIKKICEKLMDSVNHELTKGIENVDTKELGEAIDMIKDLYEAKKEMYEACYYKQVMEAMEEHNFDDEWEIEEEGRRGYRGQPRNSMGRFTSRGRGRGGRRGFEPVMMMPEEYDQEEMYRDMDMEMGRMYYQGQGGSSGGGRGSSSGGSSGGRGNSGSRGSSSGGSSRYGYSHDKYMEERRKYSKEDPEDKKKRTELLNEYMDDFMDSAKEMISDMSQEEKQMWKVKLNKLINM